MTDPDVATTGIADLARQCARLASFHATTAEGIGDWFIGVAETDPAAVVTWATLSRDHGRLADAWTDRIPTIDIDDLDVGNVDEVSVALRTRFATSSTTTERIELVTREVDALTVDTLDEFLVDPRLDAPTDQLLRETRATLDRHRHLLAALPRTI